MNVVLRPLTSPALLLVLTTPLTFVYALAFWPSVVSILLGACAMTGIVVMRHWFRQLLATPHGIVGMRMLTALLAVPLVAIGIAFLTGYIPVTRVLRDMTTGLFFCYLLAMRSAIRLERLLDNGN